MQLHDQRIVTDRSHAGLPVSRTSKATDPWPPQQPARCGRLDSNTCTRPNPTCLHPASTVPDINHLASLRTSFLLTNQDSILRSVLTGNKIHSHQDHLFHHLTSITVTCHKNLHHQISSLASFHLIDRRSIPTCKVLPLHNTVLMFR